MRDCKSEAVGGGGGGGGGRVERVFRPLRCSLLPLPARAALALVALKPVLRDKRTVDYLLAFVGGVMLAVCALELWPEGRRCRRDARLAQGIAVGAAVMLWTLWVGV